MGENLTLKDLDVELDLEGFMDPRSDGTLIHGIIPVEGFGSMMVNITSSERVTLEGHKRLFWGQDESNLNFNGQKIDMLDGAEKTANGWRWVRGSGYNQDQGPFRFMSSHAWFDQKVRDDVSRAIFKALAKLERERPAIFLLADRRNLLGKKRKAEREERNLQEEILHKQVEIEELLKEQMALAENIALLDSTIETEVHHRSGETDGLGRTFF